MADLLSAEQPPSPPPPPLPLVRPAEAPPRPARTDGAGTPSDAGVTTRALPVRDRILEVTQIEGQRFAQVAWTADAEQMARRTLDASTYLVLGIFAGCGQDDPGVVDRRWLTLAALHEGAEASVVRQKLQEYEAAALAAREAALAAMVGPRPG